MFYFYFIRIKSSYEYINLTLLFSFTKFCILVLHLLFTHLFYACVPPVLLHGSEACGFYKFNKCDRIRFRAMRFYLGVHIYAAIPGLQGEMRWVSHSVDKSV